MFASARFFGRLPAGRAFDNRFLLVCVRVCVCVWVCGSVCIHVYFVCFCLNFMLPIALRDTKATKNKLIKKVAHTRAHTRTHTHTHTHTHTRILSAPTVNANLKLKLIVIMQFRTKGGCLCCHFLWNVLCRSHCEASLPNAMWPPCHAVWPNTSLFCLVWFNLPSIRFFNHMQPKKTWVWEPSVH